MQLAGQLRAPGRHKNSTGGGAAAAEAPLEDNDDEGQRLLAAPVCKRRCHWRRGQLQEAPQQMIPNERANTTNKRARRHAEQQQHQTTHEQQEAARALTAAALTSSHTSDHKTNGAERPPLSRLDFLQQQQKQKQRSQQQRPRPLAAALGAHLRRLRWHFVLLALLAAPLLSNAAEASGSKVSRRSISTEAHATSFNQLTGRGKAAPSSGDKQAAAELVARQLLASYYRNKLLGQHMAELARAQPAQVVAHQEETASPEANQANQANQFQLQQGSSWTTSSELLPVASSLHASGQSHQASDNFVAYQTASVPAAQTGATLSAPANSLHQAGHKLMQPQQPQQQLTTPTLNKQLPPPAYYELGLAPTNALQLEPAPSEQVASAIRPALVASRHRDQHAADSLAEAHVVASPAPPASGTSARNGRQFNGDPAAKTANGSESSALDASKFDQSQLEAAQPAPAAPEKGVEPRQRRRMFNRILKKAEWNHLFVELSKVFVRYFLDLALKDIIGKQSGGTGSSSDSSSSSSTSGRKKLEVQSELTDLLKDFVKTAISNM